MRKSHNSLFTSSMDDGYLAQGRPHGGIGWIIKKDLKIDKHYDLSDRISAIQIGSITIIGVYLLYNNNTKERANEQRELMEKIIEIKMQAEKKQQNVLIIGDFNMDIKRETFFDKILVDYLTACKLTCIDILFTQKSAYTYTDTTRSSHIDHIIIDEASKELISTCNILNDEIENTSDHNAIQVTLKKIHLIQLEKTTNTTQQEQIKNTKIDWLNLETQAQYAQKVRKKLETYKKMSDELQAINEKEHKEARITEILADIQHQLTTSASEIAAKTQKERHMSHGPKIKKWWDYEMQSIHDSLKQAYLEYKLTNFEDSGKKETYKYYKKIFRRKQRQKSNNNTEKFARNLSVKYRQNKQEFWRMLKKKLSVGKNNKLNIDIKALKENFYKQFNEKIVNSDYNFEKRIKQQVDEYYKEALKDKYIDIKSSDIKTILKNLRNGKAIGMNGVSNEMFKYASDTQLSELLAPLFNHIINYDIIPTNLNIGMIKPIKKDSKRNDNDLNNIRPITISDTISNIYEHVLMAKIEEKYQEEELQFGFKKKQLMQSRSFHTKRNNLAL